VSAFSPEMNPNTGKPKARPDCILCKRLIVRVVCDECRKRLCLECSRTRADAPGRHFCPDCVDQLLFPFVDQVVREPERRSSTAS
jgi:hypothetical protein